MNVRVKNFCECLHGKTQNRNEFFNSMVWERLPKTKYNALAQLEFATYDAAAQFNIGRKATVMTYEKLDMCKRKNGFESFTNSKCCI